MRAKVPLADSAEQGAAVVVIKYFKRVATLAALFMLVISYQNCAVELSPNTPGAASLSCSPSPTALTEFQLVENTILQPTGPIGSTGKESCGACHGESSVRFGRSVYLIYGTAGSNNTVNSIKNYCSAQRKGAGRMLHCLEVSHSGGQYLQSEIPDFVTVVNKYF